MSKRAIHVSRLGANTARIDVGERTGESDAMNSILTKSMLVLLGVVLLQAGCAAKPYLHIPNDGAMARRDASAIPSPEQPRSLAMFNREGWLVRWSDLVNALQWADVIVVGEQHDDAIGHAVELAIAQDVFAIQPRSAISLEMLERDEQPVLDDYMDGIVDAATLAKLTFSEKWAGEGSWTNWYQPLIDSAKSAGGRAVAANAPRRYVRLARTEGFDRLKSLPATRRRLFEMPVRMSDDSYRQRFVDLMGDTGSHGGAGSEVPNAAFRSQSVWDATMAASIAQARRDGAKKVVHVVGQFHSDFNGGTVQQLRARQPGARILVVSLQRDDVNSLRDEDRGRADIIVYTGRRPPEPEPEATPAKPVANPNATQKDSEPKPETTIPAAADPSLPTDAPPG